MSEFTLRLLALAAVSLCARAETELPAVHVSAGTGSSPTGQSALGELPGPVASINGTRIQESINVIDAEDALKYLPSLNVRKRHSGDYDHAVLSSRTSGSGNSARSLVYVDGLLIANLLGNGAFHTPRWGMIDAAAVEQVDVLYGPFSARYSGHSLGAVVEYQTRMPTRFQARAQASLVQQPYSLYGTQDSYGAQLLQASLGNRQGAWAWTLGLQQLHSDSQPASYVTRPLASGGSAGGTDVSGAVSGYSPQGQAWLLLGSNNQIDSQQQQLRWRLTHDFANGLQAAWTLGHWTNEVERHSQSWLRDAAGNAVTQGSIRIDGRSWDLQPGDFGLSTASLQHWLHGLSLQGSGTVDWQLAASHFNYAEDAQRSQTDFQANGAGRLNDQSGSGWTTLSAQMSFYPFGPQVGQKVELGSQWQRFRLRQQLRDIRSGWSHAPADTLFSVFNGESELLSLYGQHDWQLTPALRLVSGLRLEQWWAGNGEIGNADSGIIERPLTRREYAASPSALLSWQVQAAWQLRAAVGHARRVPTVSELFQGTVEAGTEAGGPAWVVRNSNGQLQAENSWVSELSSLWQHEYGQVRVSLFHERTRNALYNQPVPPDSGATVRSMVQNVGRIDSTGLEAALQWDDVLLHGLDLESSLTWVDSRIVSNPAFAASEGRWQPRVPRWRASWLAHWRSPTNWTASLAARYSGRQYGQLDNSDINGDSYMGFSDWLVIDARVRYPLSRRWTAAVGIDNLGNASYWAFHPYPQRTLLLELAYGR